MRYVQTLDLGLVVAQPVHKVRQVTAFDMLTDEDTAGKVIMFFKQPVEGLADCTQLEKPSLSVVMRPHAICHITRLMTQ